MKEPEWTAVRVKLSDLAPWDDNPVILTQAAAKKLIKSTKALGRLQSIAIGPRDESGKYPLYDGHQRANVWGAAYGMDLEVNALMSDRLLDDDERHAVPIMTRAAVGALNWETSWLTQWPDQVKDWGYDEDTLKWLNNDAANLATMLGVDTEETQEENEYSTKVSTPIYEIKGDKPVLSELLNDEKFTELVSDIDSSDLPEDIKVFLRAAATRHIVFDFSKIAEYYAHADKPLQKLMEDSALVIIDFDRAIELGYVRLSEKIQEQFDREHPNG